MRYRESLVRRESLLRNVLAPISPQIVGLVSWYDEPPPGVFDFVEREMVADVKEERMVLKACLEFILPAVLLPIIEEYDELPVVTFHRMEFDLWKTHRCRQIECLYQIWDTIKSEMVNKNSLYIAHRFRQELWVKQGKHYKQTCQIETTYRQDVKFVRFQYEMAMFNANPNSRAVFEDKYFITYDLCDLIDSVAGEERDP